MGSSFVWMGTMRTTTMARPFSGWETDLDAGARADTRERFLRQAGGELDRAWRLAGLILGDRHDAEDATQEALIRAWSGLGSLRDPAGFQAWFDRILVNVCRDRLRRRARIRFLPLDEGGAAAVPDPFRDVLDRDETLRALAVLDADERLVVVLHYWADLPLADVAARAGWPLGTVKSRLHRALGKVGRQLGARAAADADGFAIDGGHTRTRRRS
jgi:RNA polymerase sigma-70 factor, ECF subfamily